MKDQYRHGDIFFERIDKKIETEKLIKKEKPIVEYGELTGHAHQFLDENVEVYQKIGSKQNSNYVIIKEKPAKIVHDEHDPIEIPPGTYEVIRQKEYNPYSKAARMVAD